MKKFFLKIYTVLLTVLINVNVLYRLVGYVLCFLNANNRYYFKNDLLNLLYAEEKSIIFVFISAFCFIVFAVLSLFLCGIVSKKERAVYALSALIPFIIPQAVPYAIPLFVWNIIFVFGIIALTTYFIYLIYLCVSVVKR